MDIQQTKKEIGIKLRRAREEKGYSQEEIAELLGGRTQEWYSAIERGRTLIGLEYLLKLPSILEKPVTYFLPISAVSEKEERRLMLDPRFCEIAEIWPNLSDEGKDLLYRMAVIAGDKESPRRRGGGDEAVGPAPLPGGDA